MSLRTLNKDYTKTQLDVVSLENKVKVLMPDEVLNKIKYLCKSIPKVEWSGILFYSIKGTITQPDDMVITLEDILPMDMGTSASTEYEIDGRYIEYLMENPEAQDWYMGHIHSHNTMNVYFSAVDMSELNDNSENHNFYLSLIVNNYMDFTAKVAFRGVVDREITDIPYKALDENGNPYDIETKILTIKKEKMYTYDCNIVSKVEQVLINKGFSDKVADIMKPKQVNNFPKKKSFKGNNHPFKNFEKGEVIKKAPTVHPDDVIKTPEELFVMCLLNFSTIPGDDTTIEDLLSDIEALEVSGVVLSSSIADNLAQVYNRQFPYHAENVEHFIETIEESIQIMECYEKDYPVICQSVGMLKEMIAKFELYDTRE